MIYLDNAATTLYKPPEVGQAMLDALQTAGNPGRGAHAPTLHASRIVYETREALAQLFHAEGPACIAFASNATQALNTAINGLFGPGDHVITTVCEHNSVLRPLYRLQRQGVEVSFVDVDANGVLCYAQFEQLLRPNTRGVVVTGASNVTGNRTDLAFVSAFAKKHGLLFLVDAAQTAGAMLVDVQALGIDVLCFTGHKGLLGPQGTGGLYVRPGLQAAPLVVGGSGVHSFDEAVDRDQAPGAIWLVQDAQHGIKVERQQHRYAGNGWRPLRQIRPPELGVGRNGNHIGNTGNDPAKPVSPACEKSGPRAQQIR